MDNNSGKIYNDWTEKLVTKDGNLCKEYGLQESRRTRFADDWN